MEYEGSREGLSSNDMRRLLVATEGMVFTLASIEHLVAHTRIRDFVTRPVPEDMR